jgi:glycosyltransferase involved in cell wall biosynthesis
MHPKLTVGVPHLDRTEFLAETIECLLDQSVPCKILVADQGKTDATFELMRRYKDNPLVAHVPTEATCLWENWRAAADLAMDGGAEYFAWCQDDDIIHRRYSERINLAFDGFADAQTWCARLAIAHHKRLAIWWKGPGPFVPSDLLHNIPTVIPGELLTPVSYFTSWALSPAAAFRCGRDFRDAMSEVPERCDLYTERTILAAMGRKGRVVCDPVVIGYWRQHAENVSRRQNLYEKPDQEKAFLEWTDRMMDALPDWRVHLSDWASIMPNDDLHRFLYAMQGLESRYVYAVADVLTQSMKEEVLYDDLRRKLNPQPDQPLVI